MKLMVNRLCRGSSWLVALPGSLASLWRRDYHDSRIILEQEGDLKYFSVSGHLQRNVVRGLILLGSASAVTITVLAVFSALLVIGNAKLERSHNEIYSALLGSADDLADKGVLSMSKDDMLVLAQTIRERDIEIRRFVKSSATTLTSDNISLKARLDATGLSEKAIKVIHGNVAMGGFRSDQVEPANPLLRGKLSDAIAKNHDLMNVLNALPAKMPLSDFSTSSSFGIRNHPITGRPKFHTGVDLIAGSSDDVRATKGGKVVLARSYQDYGNTVIIRHERGLETLYAHLARIDVKEGQDVDLSTVLGLVGNTGSSTGKHLHFEISVGGYPVDPQKVIETAYYVQKTKN
jgi:murein DD-endopeptidase MepM/ murein hydrolase activator NlpD